jgi:hypothetical protein
MTTAVLAQPTALKRQFFWARAQLIEARRRRSLKDSPANRMAVLQCQGIMDAVLDDYLAQTRANSGAG